MRLSVIIVNWNGGDHLGRCLDSVADATVGLETEVIVVDNLSTDSSVDPIRERFPRARVIKNQANVGFGRGAQIGVEAARGKFLAIMNPDLVLGPGSLSHLVDLLQNHPTAGWTGPKVVDPNGVVISGALKLGTMFEPLRYVAEVTRLMATPAQRKARDAPERCEKLQGACMVFRASMLDAVGGMPTLNFLWGEEQVLGTRFRKRGYEVWYDPLSTVAHERGAAVKQQWTPEEATVTQRVAHTAAMRETLGYPRFLVYDFLLLLWLLLMLGAGLVGRGYPPRLSLRLMKLSVAALGPGPVVLATDGFGEAHHQSSSRRTNTDEGGVCQSRVLLGRWGRAEPARHRRRSQGRSTGRPDRDGSERGRSCCRPRGRVDPHLRASYPFVDLAVARCAQGPGEPWSIARSAVPWFRWLRAERPDVVVTNTAVIPTPALASAMAGVPHVWWLHEFVTKDHGLRYTLGEPASQRAIGWLSKLVVTNSRAVQDHFSPPIPREKMRVVHQGIRRFRRRSQQGSPPRSAGAVARQADTRERRATCDRGSEHSRDGSDTRATPARRFHSAGIQRGAPSACRRSWNRGQSRGCRCYDGAAG